MCKLSDPYIKIENVDFFQYRCWDDLYVTWMLYNLPVKPPLTDVRMLTVHLTTRNNLQPVGITNCEVTIGNTSKSHTFILCKHLTKDVVIWLDMHHINRMGCGWTEEGRLYLHQGCNILISSIIVGTNDPKLQTVSTIQISSWAIATIPARKTGTLPQMPVVCEVLVDDE